MPLEKLAEKTRGKIDPLTEGNTTGADPGVTDKMPVVPHKVLYTGLPIYLDEGCTQQAEGHLSILQPLDPDGFVVTDVVPSTKTYQPGQYLNWQLNKEKLWEQGFYKNPESGQVETAWTMHVEFVGRVISDAALEKDRDRIEALEKKYAKDEKNVM